MKIFKSEKQESQKIPHYRSCKKLPAIKFFDTVIADNDLRGLLVCDELPENYDTKYLEPVLLEIQEEYDSLTKRNDFKNGLDLQSEDYEQINRFIGIRAAFRLMILGEKVALEYLKFWGYDIPDMSIKSITRVRNMLMSEENRFHIEQLSTKAGREEKPDSFVSWVAVAENVLKRDIDEQKITVAKWIYLQKEVEKRITRNAKIDVNA
jgi:hypothetical protein